jgi:hypothetical protein
MYKRCEKKRRRIKKKGKDIEVKGNLVKGKRNWGRGIQRLLFHSIDVVKETVAEGGRKNLTKAIVLRSTVKETKERRKKRKETGREEKKKRSPNKVSDSGVSNP